MVGLKGEGVEEELAGYLNPGKIEFPVQKLLEDALGGKRIRSLGNEADVRYYHLILLNSLITNPKVFSASSYEVGVEYGKKLAPFLERYYNKKGEELFEAISHYYGLLKHLQIKIRGRVDEIRLTETAEISGLLKNEDFLGFLFGELEGLLSVITEEKVVYSGKAFEGDELVIKLRKEA